MDLVGINSLRALPDQDYSNGLRGQFCLRAVCSVDDVVPHPIYSLEASKIYIYKVQTKKANKVNLKKEEKNEVHQ